MSNYLPCLYALLACFAFGVVFEEKKPEILFFSAFTGSAAWFVYLVFSFLGSGIRMQTLRYLLAAITAAALSEIFARILKSPTTVFLTIGLIPLVPGAGIYYTMENLINGNMPAFSLKGIETVACAGAIAVGCSFVSSLVKIIFEIKNKNKA